MIKLQFFLPAVACAIAGCSVLSIETRGQDMQGKATQTVDETVQTHPLENTVNEYYAYTDRFDNGVIPMTDKIRNEGLVADTKQKETRYVERALLLLADHHAMASSNLPDSWGVSNRSDIWIEQVDGQYVATSVRTNSPAASAGIAPGARLTHVGEMNIDEAVAKFWADLGVAEETDPERNAFAARVLTTGRRDRVRELTLVSTDGHVMPMTLPNLYSVDQPEKPLVEVVREASANRIIFNDSLGNMDTIAAFDAVMETLDRAMPIVLDLRETASGGNTVIAKAIMGWFIEGERPYQIHSIPAVERQYGVVRKWIELIQPRKGKHHPGTVEVLVGRWTGSMGEGMAIGMDALGHDVCGTRMAGLLGAVYTLDLEDTDLRINLPAERLYAVDGTPREDFVPDACKQQ